MTAEDKPIEPESDDGTLPPIPDGGLGAAMPDWLQRPPSWKRAPVSEPAARELPEPDSSQIDPRTMLDIEDLPGWLQAIARRPAAVPEVEAGPDPEVAPVEQGPAQTEGDPGQPVATSDVVIAESHPVDVAPANVARHPEPEPQTVTAVERPWWTSDWVHAALLIAVVATIVYVVLIASGVL